jgi:hypothetical protein
MRKSFALTLISVLIVLAAISAYAKDPPAQMIVWPESGAPILHFTFGKFKEISSMGSQRTYVTDTMVENVWSKPISNANFSLYLFDKSKVRIAEAVINVSNVAAGETVKFQTTVSASGPPASLSVVARYLPKELAPLAPPRMVSITVNTVPQGAVAKLDGVEVGTTPKIVQVPSENIFLNSAGKDSTQESFRSRWAQTTLRAGASASSSEHRLTIRLNFETAAY